MTKGLRVALALLITLIWIGGCLRQWVGMGHVYPVRADQAWEVAQAVLRWNGAGVIEGKFDDQYMIVTAGERIIGVSVEAVDTQQAKVSISAVRRGPFSSSGYPQKPFKNLLGLTEEKFHKDFVQGMEIVKAGKPLPAEAPE